MRTSPLDIAGGQARWVSDTEGGTWLQWSLGQGPAVRVPFAALRRTVDLLAGAVGHLWARSLPTVVQLYDGGDSWIYHASRLQPLHDLPCTDGVRCTVHRWGGEWVVEYHHQVATPGVSVPLLAAVSAVLGRPAAIR